MNKLPNVQRNTSRGQIAEILYVARKFQICSAWGKWNEKWHTHAQVRCVGKWIKRIMLN